MGLERGWMLAGTLDGTLVSVEDDARRTDLLMG